MTIVSNALRALLLAAFAVAALVGITPSAHANDIPFWERADLEKAKAAKRKMYLGAPSGKYSYAYSSGKKRYGSKPRGKSGKYAVKRKKLGGYAAATEPKRRKAKGVRVAALGNSYYGESTPKKSLTGGSVRWVASAGCLDSGLKAVLYQVANNFGPLTVSSTCRAKGHNRKVGGAPKSKHLTGDAADFRVHGNVRGVYAFLRSHGSIGGLKHYGGGLFHIDNGDRRSW